MPSTWRRYSPVHRLPLSSILYVDLIEFSENSCFINPVKLRAISPVPHFLKCVQAGTSLSIAEISFRLSKILLHKVSKRFLRFFTYEHRRKWYRDALKSRCSSLLNPPVLHFYFMGLKKCFILLFLHETRVKFISNQFN